MAASAGHAVAYMIGPIFEISEILNCWERWCIDVDGASYSSNILWCTHCFFWLFTLWFIDEDASFLHFFHKITNIQSWWCFSSSKIHSQFSHTFCNITMIFKVISEYFSALFNLYTTIFVRQDQTNYLWNQTWARCCNSRNKHLLKKKR